MILTIAIAVVAFGAILLRPRHVAEWIIACAGAAALVLCGALAPAAAASAVLEGWNVYFFLAGMIALAEIARSQGVFDWIASAMERAGKGSGARLFVIVYLAGVAVTALLSNDGTVLLLTPVAIALARRSGQPPLPYAFACVFVANAASFVLPISNPANLVVFAQLPPLGTWLASFALSSAAAIAATGAILYAVFRSSFVRAPNTPFAPAALNRQGKAAFVTVSVSCALLVAAAAYRFPLGIAAAACAAGSLLCVTLAARGLEPLRAALRHGTWSIVPLVAALFVIIRALLSLHIPLPHEGPPLVTGFAVALAANALNNLPAAVLAHYALGGSHSALIGIDLGPNVAITGSLATILWIAILRANGITMTAWRFFKLGLLVGVAALALSLALAR
ncbi:MAG: SLC13 family permease [Candidatus Baltobacteraceae bacterium]